MRLNQKGVSLIEVLLSVSIVTILLGSLVSFAIVSAGSQAKAVAVLEVEQQGAFIEAYLNRMIRESESISTPSAGATGTSLVLVMPSGEPSPITISLTGTNLQTTEGASPVENLHSQKVEISSLQFSNRTVGLGPGSVEFSFTLSATNPSGRNEFSYSRTFSGGGSLR